MLAILSSVATHPLIIVAGEITLAAILIGFTSPGSFWRIATLPFPLWAIWIGMQERHVVGPAGNMINLFIIGHQATYFLDYIDVVLLRKWTFEARGPTDTLNRDSRANGTALKTDGSKTNKSPGSFRSRLAFGFQTATSRRHINTPYETKNCPHFSAEDKSYVPSRSRYMLRTLGSVVACYLFVDINDATSLSGENARLFAPDQIPFFFRLGSVTIDQIALRLVIAVMVWAATYCLIRMAYDMVGIAAVSLRITGVRSWRPLFGSVWDLYTLRRFWGNFWHQMLRDPLSSPAKAIARILRLPDTGIFQRYTKTAIIFSSSGLAHQFHDATVGLPFAESGAIRFFAVQTVGIMLEDAVQTIWDGGFGRRKSQNQTGTVRWKKMVGVIWLWAWLAWSVPVWVYPAIYDRTKREQGPLMGPFSLSRWFLSRS
ncbi:membrane bound O-acyl transferase family-domain-containing protein [Coniochaeta sp. 2T2.1]|nr:membrane bound O-acyl transferase family-domain-containing protein [Coniochaeta sp. 2T2.1]